MKKLILIFISIVWFSFLQAQVSFNIKPSDKKIGKQDQLQATYEVSNANSVGGFQAPAFNDWNIVSGPEYSQQSININGKISGSISYIFILSPKKTGDIKLPGTSISADGKKLSCNDVTINVSSKDHVASGQSSPQGMMQMPPIFDDTQTENFVDNSLLKKGESPAEKIRENIFVKLTASKTSCYVGEPVLVTYQLFSALNEDAKIKRQPVFNGVSVIEMTNPQEQNSVQKIGDKIFHVSTIRRVQLIPLQEGELKLDTAIIDNTVNFSPEDNPYQTQAYQASLPSNPLSITVKPLPEKNKPHNFSGVVGNFTIAANADSTSIAAGENNILQIKIEGQGNFAGIEQPTVLWSKNSHPFEGTDTQHIDKTVFPMSGDITFEIPFVSEKEGSDSIPGISFSFFDPETGTYKTVRSQTIGLLVTQAIPKSQQFKNIVTENITSENYVWIVALIAVIVAAFFIFSVKKKTPSTTKIPETQTPQPAVITQQPTTTIFETKTDYPTEIALLQNENDNRQFFLRAKTILTKILKDKTNSASNSTSELLSALPEFTTDENIIADAQNIYKICNYSLYSPMISEEEKTLLQTRLELLIKTLEV